MAKIIPISTEDPEQWKQLNAEALRGNSGCKR